jgi:hypothetical protein
MTQAEVIYRRNATPSRGLAVTGIFTVKWFLAIPHFVIVGILGYLAMAVGYIGYFIVAFTGTLPGGLQDFIAWWMRWWVRAYGWVAGIADEYPPFETDPAGYGIDAAAPHNDSPSRGWAVAGIFFVKALAAIPHLLAVGILMFVAMLAMWIGFFVVAFTGKLPDGLQDFVAGTFQWMIRVTAWVTGLTDEYPPFSLDVTPRGSDS